MFLPRAGLFPKVTRGSRTEPLASLTYSYCGWEAAGDGRNAGDSSSTPFCQKRGNVVEMTATSPLLAGARSIPLRCTSKARALGTPLSPRNSKTTASPRAHADCRQPRLRRSTDQGGNGLGAERHAASIGLRNGTQRYHESGCAHRRPQIVRHEAPMFLHQEKVYGSRDAMPLFIGRTAEPYSTAIHSRLDGDYRKSRAVRFNDFGNRIPISGTRLRRQSSVVEKVATGDHR